MTAADLAARLSGGATRRGEWYAGRCPAHDDQRASLSFRDGDRSVLLTCHAGCTHADIRRALGIDAENLRLPHGSNGHGAPEVPRIVATYDYADTTGALLYQAVRYEPKQFRQRRPDGRGGWTWNLDGVPRVLYRLPALKGRALVFLVEGEKDADRLWRLDLPATTGAMGAGKWRTAYAAQLRDSGVAEVVVLPDNDRPGMAHAEAVARSCHDAGLIVRLVTLPGLPAVQEKHGEDVSDWLDAGHSAEELHRAVGAAPRWTPGPTMPAAMRGPTTMRFTLLGDLLDEPEETTAWLIEGRLPMGGISLLAGKPKAGKSTLVRCLCLAVGRGDPWLGWATVKGPVFYLALEEKRGEVRRHFRAMGARGDEDVRFFIAPSPEDGLRQLREATERERPVLIVVDPLLRFVRVRDANDYAVVTAALEPLVTLARETGAHVLAVHHEGKLTRDGGDGIIGSTAFFAAVDTALLLRRSEKYRTLSTIQRYGDDLEEITLTLDPVTRWVSAGPSRREADEAKVAEAIVEYLAAQTEPVEEPAIHEAVTGSKAIKVRALRQLVAETRAVRTGGGKKGDPYRYAAPPGVLDAGFLVPPFLREPANQQCPGGASASLEATDSGSRVFPGSHPSIEPNEPATHPLLELVGPSPSCAGADSCEQPGCPAHGGDQLSVEYGGPVSNAAECR